MSLGLMTTAPPICWAKDRCTVQVRPFHRSARDCAPPAVNAQTSPGDAAPAATTTSLGLPGNGTCVQVDPLRRQAVGTGPWLKAQPPVRPTAMTAVKPPNGPLCTCLTMSQAGVAGCVVAGAGAARADEAVEEAAAEEAAVGKAAALASGRPVSARPVSARAAVMRGPARHARRCGRAAEVLAPTRADTRKRSGLDGCSACALPTNDDFRPLRRAARLKNMLPWLKTAARLVRAPSDRSQLRNFRMAHGGA